MTLPQSPLCEVLTVAPPDAEELRRTSSVFAAKDVAGSIVGATDLSVGAANVSIEGTLPRAARSTGPHSVKLTFNRLLRKACRVTNSHLNFLSEPVPLRR